MATPVHTSVQTPFPHLYTQVCRHHFHILEEINGTMSLSGPVQQLTVKTKSSSPALATHKVPGQPELYENLSRKIGNETKEADTPVLLTTRLSSLV